MDGTATQGSAPCCVRRSPSQGNGIPGTIRSQQLVQRQAQDAVDQQALAAETGQPHARLGVVLHEALHRTQVGRPKPRGVLDLERPEQVRAVGGARSPSSTGEPTWCRAWRSTAAWALRSAQTQGEKLVSDITSADLLQLLAPIWHDKPETARRVRQRIGAVMKWAVAMQHRPDNPAGEALGQALGRQQNVVRHMTALLYDEVAGAVAVVRASRAWTGTKLAFEFLVLTAARSGEVRLATWDEIDIGSAVWTVPASRMKTKRDHRVPLCGRAVEILHEARPLSGATGLVFPSSRGNPLSNMTLSKLVKEQGIAAVPHGFRSSFRDWAAERTNHPREVIEAALAHVVANRVEAAYARSDLFARRRLLMDDWAGYLGEERGRVIPMRR